MPTYSAFVIDGGPNYTGSLDQAPVAYQQAVQESASGGDPEVFDSQTGGYDLDTSATDEGGSVAPSADPSLSDYPSLLSGDATDTRPAVQTDAQVVRTNGSLTSRGRLADSSDANSPDSVASGFYLPEGTLRSNYRWDQTDETRFGVLENPDGDIVAEVFGHYSETITGNTSDYWKYAFTLDYQRGGLYTFDVNLTCAVNITGHPDDYCSSITYPNGDKDTNVTASHDTQVHDLATGNTVNSNPTGLFGLRTTPPPSGSTQVVKFAHLTESAYFSDYDTTATNYVRGWDVCVPNKSTFSKVVLCSSSGTGH